MSSERRDLARAWAATAVGVTAISFAAIFFRETAPTSPLVAAGWRLVLAALLLAPLSLRAYRAGTLRGRLLRDAALGGVFYALHFGAWVSSLHLTSVAASVTLVTATPVLLAGIAALTGRDRATGRQLIAIALATAGALLIGGGDLGTEGALTGDALALFGAAAMAGYLLVVRRHGGRLPPLAFGGVACAVGGALLLGAALVTGTGLAPASERATTFIVLSALVPQIVGHGSLTWALRRLSPTAVGLATAGEPVGAALLAWAFLSELPRPTTLVGCAIILGAVAL
ncbi:MAG: DMT family transporter, partial [Myxococcota bacterium]